jgi:NmrA-like family protein
MILVTGATGMFGGRVLRESVVRGAHVRGLVHSPGRTDEIEAAGAEAVVGDLDRPDTLAPAVEGVERVFLVTGVRAADGRGSDDGRGLARGPRLGVPVAPPPAVSSTTAETTRPGYRSMSSILYPSGSRTKQRRLPPSRIVYGARSGAIPRSDSRSSVPSRSSTVTATWP